MTEARICLRHNGQESNLESLSHESNSQPLNHHATQEKAGWAKAAYVYDVWQVEKRSPQKTHWSESLPKRIRKRKASYLHSVPRRNRNIRDAENSAMNPISVCACVFYVHLLLFVPVTDRITVVGRFQSVFLSVHTLLLIISATMFVITFLAGSAVHFYQCNNAHSSMLKLTCADLPGFSI